MVDEEERRHRKAADVRRVFTPSTPVKQNELFAGRIGEIERLLYAIQNAGQHAVMYGEPGVGKTSLGKKMDQLLRQTHMVSLYTSCGTSDDFSSIWRAVLGQVEINTSTQKMGFQPSNARSLSSSSPMSDLLPEGELTQSRVADVLENLASGPGPVVVFVDEFDRAKSRARRPFAELVKLLSDNGVDVTIVFIGVAENVEQLIDAHRSTERNLHQIRMPRMSVEELAEIVDKGLTSLSMTIHPLALRRVAVLSRGLPHFTHLVAQHSAVRAVMQGRDEVTVADVEKGVESSVQQSQHSLVSAHSAAISSRSGIYRDVLLGCALAESDDQGWVTPAAVRAQMDTLSLSSGPSVTKYLSQLSTSTRGNILCETGPSRRHAYRFSNPLMQPYVVMKGLVSGIPVEKVAN